MSTKAHASSVIVDGHYSGRFTATYEQWLALCDEMSTQGAQRWSTTECGGKAARQALEHWTHNHGWDLVHFPGYGDSECAILSEPKVVRLLESEVLPLTDLTLDSARKAPMRAPVAHYLHVPSGLDDWRSAAHLPAHLEGPHGFTPGRAATVHASAVAGWKHGMKGLAPRTLMFDSNVNVRLAWVRDWLDHTFPRMTSAWGRHLPKWGTFRRRVIDLVMTTVTRVGAIERVEHMDGFDHVGFIVRLDLARPTLRSRLTSKENR